MAKRARAAWRYKPPITIDFTTEACFRSCEEKARLRHVLHLVPKREKTYFVFGRAFHAAIDAWYTTRDTREAELAFIKNSRELPIDMDSGEKRSIERGTYLVQAYIERWKAEPFEVVKRPDNGEPLIEQSFTIPLCEWRGHPVFYSGRIDKVMRSRTDGLYYLWETKTTTKSLSLYMNQVRPNHQITGYFAGARALVGDKVAGVYWDCIFVSERKADPKAKDPWLQLGIDMDKDFARRQTQRSQTDIDEFLRDASRTATRFLDLKFNAPGLDWEMGDPKVHWDRSAPTACYQYGGCEYLDICSHNLNPNIIRNNYRIEEWEAFRR